MNCQEGIRKEARIFKKKFNAASDERFSPVYSFYRDVWPEIRKRQLGLDRLPEGEQKIVDGIKNVPVILERGAKNQGMYGNWRYLPWIPLLGRTEDIRIKEDDPDVDRNLAHELRHYLATHIPSLTSDKETDRLNGVYGFKDSKSIYPLPVRILMPWLTNEELYATNTEHQYRIYKDLAGKLGRAPSGKEFMDYLDSANDKDFYNKERLKPVGYDGWPEHKPNYLQNLRKKWSESEWAEWLKRFKDFKGVIGGLASVKSENTEMDVDKMRSGSVKAAQAEGYTAKGGAIGALSGAAIATLYKYIIERRQGKKKSIPKRVLDWLLWAGAGAAAGGIAGAGIGRAIGANEDYRIALDRARKKISETRRLGAKKRTGRVLYVNFPENKMDLGDDEMRKALPGFVGKGTRERLKRMFPKGIKIQHAGVLTMDNDGGNARFFDVGDTTPQWSRSAFVNKIISGIKEKDDSKILAGANGIEKGLTWGNLTERYFGNKFKGKSDEQIAKLLADYGRNAEIYGNYGDTVNMFEGEKNVDLDLVHRFIEEYHDRANGNGGTGYTILPGGYNCGTSARAAFDSVQSPLSHVLDMLYGGFPSSNAPLMAKRTTARSHDVDNRPKAFVRPLKSVYRIKGDEMF